MTFRVYVAASSLEHARARAAMAIVRELGCEATLDWTQDVERDGGNPLHLSGFARSVLARCDVDAVRESDLLWVLAPRGHASRGQCVELGVALALDKPILITGEEDDRRASIFFDLATVCRDDDTAAVTVIPMLRGGR